MRMRRKKNLETRLEKCGYRIIYLDREDKDFRDKENKEYLDFKEIFGNENPVELEIGCGKGQFIIELAKRCPDVNFLAVELSSNVIVDGAAASLESGVDNVRFLRGNARYLDCFLKENSVRRIYLNFSCPYPKNTYAGRRLTHESFLELYKRFLVPGGEIFQKTDNMHFFEFSIEEFSKTGYGLRNISLDLHNSEYEGNIVTEYEQRFSDMGMPIYRLEAYLK